MSKWSVIIAVIVIAILVIAAFAFVYTYLQSPEVGPLDFVTVGLEFTQVNTLIFVAENQNYFAANGLNVTIREYASGVAALTGLTNGEVDIATSSEFAIVGKALTDSDISVFGNIDKFLQIFIVGRKDAGIENIPDLANKTIGLTLGSSSQFFLGRLLELNGMSISQVTLVNTPTMEVVSALTNGAVDAVVTWRPFVNEIENRMSDNVVIWPAQGGQLIYCAASATNSWIADHNNTITKFLQAISQAENHLNSNTANAKAILESRLNFTTEYVNSIWPDHQFTLSLDQSLVLAMEDEARWLISNNLTNATAVPNFLNYFYLDGLVAVKPNSVTIIR